MGITSSTQWVIFTFFIYMFSYDLDSHLNKWIIVIGLLVNCRLSETIICIAHLWALSITVLEAWGPLTFPFPSFYSVTNLIPSFSTVSYGNLAIKRNKLKNWADESSCLWNCVAKCWECDRSYQATSRSQKEGWATCLHRWSCSGEQLSPLMETLSTRVHARVLSRVLTSETKLLRAWTDLACCREVFKN